MNEPCETHQVACRLTACSYSTSAGLCWDDIQVWNGRIDTDQLRMRCLIVSMGMNRRREKRVYRLSGHVTLPPLGFLVGEVDRL